MTKKLFFVSLIFCLTSFVILGCSTNEKNTSSSSSSVRIFAEATQLTSLSSSLVQSNTLFSQSQTSMTYFRPTKERVCVIHVALCSDLNGNNAWVLFDGQPVIYEFSQDGVQNLSFSTSGLYPPANTTFNCLETIAIWDEVTIPVNWPLIGGDTQLVMRKYINDYGEARRGDITVIINGQEKWIKSDFSQLLDNRSDGTPYQTTTLPQVGSGTDHNGKPENFVQQGNYIMGRNQLAASLTTGSATGTYTFIVKEDISQGFGYQDTSGDGKFEPDPTGDGMDNASSQPTYTRFEMIHGQ